MSRQIHCLKLNKLATGLDTPPYPGDLGKKIYENISASAWQLWLDQQTMLINERRLSLLEENARLFLLKEMEKFLFGEGSERPSGYVAPKSKA